ncbi:hypothetical protein C8R44DRAFT_310010 [Mycena epipterygia]|nr:hypothetical protein C8R44DRAFT_310010 [Mycena epipterygia]
MVNLVQMSFLALKVTRLRCSVRWRHTCLVWNLWKQTNWWMEDSLRLSARCLRIVYNEHYCVDQRWQQSVRFLIYWSALSSGLLRPEPTRLSMTCFPRISRSI